MTPQKRAELEAFYKKLKTDLESRAKTLRRQVHENDLELVERALPELDSVMQQVVKIEWEHALAKIRLATPCRRGEAPKESEGRENDECGK